jgi:hypothetical protein
MTDNVPLREAHAHSSRCYWDSNVCRWVCQEPVGDGNRFHRRRMRRTVSDGTRHRGPAIESDGRWLAS